MITRHSRNTNRERLDISVLWLYDACMETDEARDVLVQAEAALKELMARGLKEQRYAELAYIARLAEGVARLIDDGPHSQSSTPAIRPNRPNPRAAPAPTPTPSKKKPPSRGSSYPRFERDGDKLVKVGWSKKQKAEYEHRAGRETVIAFIRHLTSHVTEGHVFTVENLLPVPDGSGGEVPTYQVYLALAWLKSEQAVEKKGRDGYVLRDGSIAGSGLDAFWNALTVREV